MKIKTTIVAIVSLILVIIVASVAYNRLSGKHNTNDQLSLSSDGQSTDLSYESDSDIKHFGRKNKSTGFYGYRHAGQQR